MSALFSFGATFNATVHGAGLSLPIIVQRLDREQLAAFDGQWERLVLAQPWSASEAAERLAFFQAAIRQYVTLAPDGIDVDGVAVADGAGLFRVFQKRPDVLCAIALTVWQANHFISAREDS